MNLRLATVLALALALAASACGSEEEAAPAEAPASAVPTAAELAAAAANPAPAPAAPVPAPTPSQPAAAPGAAPGAPGAPVAPPNLAGLSQGLGAALQAGEANSNLPPCEQAHASIVAMLAAMQKQFGPGQANGAMPSREQFVAGCSQLPEQMQRCMTMQYAMAHQEECNQARENLDPATMARVQELMGRPAR